MIATLKNNKYEGGNGGGKESRRGRSKSRRRLRDEAQQRWKFPVLLWKQTPPGIYVAYY
jgi:hypothetical protein